MPVNSIKQDLKKLANHKKRAVLERFFKTGPGEYGEGDIFLGVTFPQQRTIARKYPLLALPQIDKLLKTKVHEYRLTALIILVNQYKKADQAKKKLIFDYYLKNTRWINNWDLVDLSAHYIAGEYLFSKKKKNKKPGVKESRGSNKPELSPDSVLLLKLASSKQLWRRRIAIVSTYHYIRHNDFANTLMLSEFLVNDKEDLIHKAVGWMLREVGKRNEKKLLMFLNRRAKDMPRTMLRYAIERLAEKKRRHYLQLK